MSASHSTRLILCHMNTLCSFFFMCFHLFCLPFLVIILITTSGRVMKWSSDPSPYAEPLRRVRSLKFRSEEQSDLNDILLRVSAFGLFVYAVFSVIAGGMGAFTHEPNLLVMITGCLSVLQVNIFHFCSNIVKSNILQTRRNLLFPLF